MQDGQLKKLSREPEEAVEVSEEAEGTMMPVATATSLPIMAGGFKIILKDAKIYANKVIIQTVKNDKDKR